VECWPDNPSAGQREAVDDPHSKPILVAELGSGGMADVFLAVRCGPGGFTKLFVLKRMRAAVGMDETDFAAMFVDEARIAARLHHSNVVETFAIRHEANRFEMEMEWLDGQSLQRIVRRAKKLGRVIERPLAVALVRQALAGLDYAHELADYDGTPLTVVHRDVGPQNIFVTYAGCVKILDFGIAKFATQENETKIGIVKGKARYMAPEQAMGRRVDRRADLFPMGIVLWELLTGRRYWGDEEEMAVFQRLRTGALPPRAREMVPDLPEALDAVCARALAHDPDQRFATAAEFGDALDAAFPSRPGEERELGRLLESMFASDRATIRSLVERAIAKSKGEVLDDATTQHYVSPLRQTSTTGVEVDTPPPMPRGSRGVKTALVLFAGLLGGMGIVLWPHEHAPQPGIAPTTAAPIVAAPPPRVIDSARPPVEAPRESAPAPIAKKAPPPARVERAVVVDAGAPVVDPPPPPRTPRIRLELEPDPWDAGRR
jgi:serine/threonine protein kinase